ncbi:unnamed protein product [Lymnaea stagnalis]|uniref:Dual specificity protein phosphatase n=1 Tax=Lymnaea stagnalis TaxID=6523 RepID=A0AAV2IL08_LYMST
MTSKTLKLFIQVKEFLSKDKNDSHKVTGHPSPTMKCFSYFALPAAPKNHCDEVYPGVWLGDADCAKKLSVLKEMKVTHVLNVCMGNRFNQVETNEEFYKEANISFHGIPALDVPTFKILPYLEPAADFIDNALAKGGVVYIHCQQGISRSATVVIAFLMLRRRMDLLTAVQQVRGRREICPNEGFLKQLCSLNEDILSKR